MISIVTGTLNRLDFLPGLLDNTIGRCADLELVLVDGGSTDGTLEYLRGIGSDRLKLVEVGHRSSYPHFMNEGIKVSSHWYVCQWNDDVILINDWSDVIDSVRGSDVCVFNWKYGNKSDITNDSWLRGNTGADAWLMHNNKDSAGNGECVMNYGVYSKRVFGDIGLYDPSFRYYYADADMCERAYHFGYGIKMLPDVKVLSVMTPKVAVHYHDDKRIFDENISMYRNGCIRYDVEKLK